MDQGVTLWGPERITLLGIQTDISVGGIGAASLFVFAMIVAVINHARGESQIETVWFVVMMWSSVLLHELGHALAMIAFGIEPVINVTGFAGLAIPDRGYADPMSQLLIFAAGPVVSIGTCWFLRSDSSVSARLVIVVNIYYTISGYLSPRGDLGVISQLLGF